MLFKKTLSVLFIGASLVLTACTSQPSSREGERVATGLYQYHSIPKSAVAVTDPHVIARVKSTLKGENISGELQEVHTMKTVQSGKTKVVVKMSDQRIYDFSPAASSVLLAPQS